MKMSIFESIPLVKTITDFLDQVNEITLNAKELWNTICGYWLSVRTIVIYFASFFIILITLYFCFALMNIFRRIWRITFFVASNVLFIASYLFKFMCNFLKKKKNFLYQDPLYNRGLIKNASVICNYFRFFDRSQIYEIAIEKLNRIINKTEYEESNERTLVVEENEIKGIIKFNYVKWEYFLTIKF